MILPTNYAPGGLTGVSLLYTQRWAAIESWIELHEKNLRRSKETRLPRFFLVSGEPNSPI
jgi:hypothetical protein